MRKLMLKNKRGDIPVTILVIGVFAICTLAILSFSLIDNKSKKGFNEAIEAIEEMNSEIEKYNFYENLGIGNSEIINLMDIKGGNIIIIKEIDGKKVIEIIYPVS